MQRERLTDDIFVFTSDRYVQVTATVIFTAKGVVVFDTLPFPDETRRMVDFIRRANRGPVRYLILSHSHADHVYGAFLMPEAEIIAHRRCYDLLSRHGRRGLEEAQRAEPELMEVVLRYPGLWVETDAALRMGDKTIQFYHSPGHTPDVIGAYIPEERTLIASDTMMPVPYIADGDPHQLIASLRALRGFQSEHLIQGHGDILLRGEISTMIAENIAYLEKLIAVVEGAVEAGTPAEDLLRIPLEEFGKERILLEGLAPQIHAANIMAYYQKYKRKAKRNAKKHAQDDNVS